MAPIIGFTALLLIISLNFFLPFFNLLAFEKDFKIKKLELSEITTGITALTFLLALIAQFCLAYSYIISDYSVLNVYQNSHHLKPLIYKIAGSWGNHEGSMLLLLTILSGYNLFFTLTNKSEFKIITLSSQSVIVLGIALFTAFASNPFELIFPTPTQGLSLNPLLQDIGLALHPPILYIGYIGFSVAFSLAIAGLIHEKINSNLAEIMQIYIFISFGFLTLGVGLGSWWAYRELGWGGYWFWDPVENVSLMPWLASAALIHCVKILAKKDGFKIWTILLAIITFILCLIGIFLVRSGLLTSVHSFAVDAKRGFFIILLITIIGGAAMLIFALKASKIKTSQSLQNKFLSKTTTILFNNYFLMIALFTMLLGLFYPLFAQNFFNSSISIGANYYNKIFAILLLPFLCFLILSHLVGKDLRFFFLKWLPSSMQAPSIKYKVTFIVTIIFSAICTFLFAINSISASALEISIFFLSVAAFFIAASSKKNVTNIAHFGFALILIGIMLSSYLSTTREVNIRLGDEIAVAQNSPYKVKFENIEYLAGKNFLARQAIFSIKKNDEELYKLKPQLRYYPVSDQTTFEAAIRHGLDGDMYLAIGNKDESENYALRIYHKPFIYLIWLGCLLIFLAVILKLIKLVEKIK